MNNPVYIEKCKPFLAEECVYPEEYKGHFSSRMIDASSIRLRIHSLAATIQEDYSGKRPTLICTLKGACPFFSHMCEALQDLRQGYDIEFVRASSYVGAQSTGNVKVVNDMKVDSFKGKHIIIFEDIIDTGTTLANLLPIFQQCEPSSCEVCTLLDKRLEISSDKKYSAKYCGFSIPDFFIVGYGLDYNELYRDVRDIFVISEKGINFDASTLHIGEE